jgi:hypothetical protein
MDNQFEVDLVATRATTLVFWKCRRDQLIQPTGNYECHDFSFPRVKADIASLDRPQILCVSDCDRALMYGMRNRIQKCFVADRLSQKLEGARLHGLHRSRNIPSICAKRMDNSERASSCV